MRRGTRVLLSVGVVAVVIGAWGYRQAAVRKHPPAATAAGESPELIVGQPVRFRNLTIFPVSSKVARNQDRFITLAEGLKSGQVEVSELGGQSTSAVADLFAESATTATNPAASVPAESVASESLAADNPFGDPGEDPFMVDAANRLSDDAVAAISTALAAGVGAATDHPFDGDTTDALLVDDDVNQLAVTNRSDAPLYLMPGEILLGGNQDRAVAEELIVPPHTERMVINVYCVEHGRWSARSPEETVQLASRLADGDTDAYPAAALVVPTAAGKFSQAAGILNKSGRLTLQSGQGQSAIWDEISSINSKTTAETDSGTFTANYTEPDVASKLEPYVAALEQPIADCPQVVGVIVAVNGEIQAADTFESTPLFRKVWPKLLTSYVLDASMQLDAEQESRACDVAAAQAFLRSAIQAKVADKVDRDGLVTTRADGEGLASFSLHESPDSLVNDPTGAHLDVPDGANRAAGAMGGGMMGGMGGGAGSGTFGGGVHSAAFSQ